MDFQRLVITLLSIQDVVFEDVKIFKKQLRLEVQVRQKRSKCFCSKCGLQVDWLQSKFESMTCGFAEVAGRLMEETACEAVIRILKSDSKMMWDLDQHRMEVMLQFLRLPKDLDIS